MRLIFSRRTIARLFFIIGVFFMFFGYIFLPGSMNNISGIPVFISIIFIILGIMCAFFAVKLKKNSLYMFFVAFSLQVGIFLLFSGFHLLPFTFSNAWPLLSIFAGIALIPAGWYRYSGILVRYIVPALSFIILCLLLFAVSFDLVSFSLQQFFKDWWPLIIGLGGLILILVSLGTRNAGEL
jgi:uncharacterized membrane protein HdeD (DUF308 family)